jgi:hypothetical protein
MGDNKIIGYCYSKQCGPVVKAGFQHEFYWVCKNCKSEITDRLAEEIQNRDKKKETQEDKDLAEMWGMFYGQDPTNNGNDDGFF